MDEFVRTFRFALRRLKLTPGFTLLNGPNAMAMPAQSYSDYRDFRDRIRPFSGR